MPQSEWSDRESAQACPQITGTDRDHQDANHPAATGVYARKADTPLARWSGNCQQQRAHAGGWRSPMCRPGTSPAWRSHSSTPRARCCCCRSRSACWARPARRSPRRTCSITCSPPRRHVPVLATGPDRRPSRPGAHRRNRARRHRRIGHPGRIAARTQGVRPDSRGGAAAARCLAGCHHPRPPGQAQPPQTFVSRSSAARLPLAPAEVRAIPDNGGIRESPKRPSVHVCR